MRRDSPPAAWRGTLDPLTYVFHRSPSGQTLKPRCYYVYGLRAVAGVAWPPCLTDPARCWPSPARATGAVHSHTTALNEETEMPSKSLKTIAQPLDRTMAEIVRDVIEDWASRGRAVPSAGAPYAEARSTSQATRRPAVHYDDPAADLVVRLIPGNYSRARGEVATRVRGELQAALAYHRQQAARRRQLAGTARA